VQLQLHLTLDQLLGGIGAPGRPWRPPGFGTRHAPAGPLNPGQPASSGAAGAVRGVPLAGPGDDCDAAVAPIVTGRIDLDLASRLAGRLARIWAEAYPGRRGCDHTCGQDGRDNPGADDDERQERSRELAEACARAMILRHAVGLLSGPDGLASWLRTGTLPAPAASVSLPLDVGTVTDLIPPHLRRAITTRDRHCAAPGCDQPPQACHVHHIVPRSQGGATSLANCLLLCPFHHLILIHRWGWTIALNADGTTTMTSPDGRTLHSHSPPEAA
jgi:HNH endonuclease